jgi:hypothetical protein
MTTQTLQPVPTALAERVTALREAFGLADVSEIDVARLDAQDCATLAFGLDEEHRRAAALFAALCKPLLDLKAAAREKVAASIPVDGKALPHPSLIVELRQDTERDKYIDELRRLEGKVPDDELRKALYLDQPAPQWKADLRQLDKIAREYGGEIKSIIEHATPRKPKGNPVLVIEARPSTIRPAGEESVTP